MGGGALGRLSLNRLWRGTRARRDPTAAPRALGIMGGTFDPIHVGHLAVAEDARETLGLDRVLFVPAGEPPHKPDGAVARARDRVDMTALAILDNPAFEVSTIEVDRPGPSYTVDTVEALARAYPSSELYLILSAETFAQLPTWHEPQRLFAGAHIAVVPREGYAAADPSWLAATFPGHDARVRYLEGPRLGVSSTAIRARVAAGRSLKRWCP